MRAKAEEKVFISDSCTMSEPNPGCECCYECSWERDIRNCTKFGGPSFYQIYLTHDTRKPKATVFPGEVYIP